jgi:hypothetical protein
MPLWRRKTGSVAGFGAWVCYSMGMNKSAHAQTLQDRADKAAIFAREWVLANLDKVPDPGDLPREIDQMACRMTADARLEGIRGGDIVRAVGDLDDFLAAEYESKKPAA